MSLRECEFELSVAAILVTLVIGMILGAMGMASLVGGSVPVRTVERVVQVPVVRAIECSRADLVDSLRPYDEPGIATKGGTK